MSWNVKTTLPILREGKKKKNRDKFFLLYQTAENMFQFTYTQVCKSLGTRCNDHSM